MQQSWQSLAPGHKSEMFLKRRWVIPRRKWNSIGGITFKMRAESC